MGFADKARNKAAEVTGAAKERIGDVSGDDRLRAEGVAQRGDARARQAGEDVKQAGRDMKRAVRR
ncbi:CsbD family protein [Micromonospora sp. WMMA1363]|uniref:CsbD family protein n=1 Tax=Micromonospora sp. WMMA1363 TaxID=3053985 RepID=UPI00259CD4DA|nr:CsbD family protein [Micromonospora sp. WMMA1363]MDM4719217.1 CsbD family protein [Micromonospora sp. WMMA1363]